MKRNNLYAYYHDQISLIVWFLVLVCLIRLQTLWLMGLSFVHSIYDSSRCILYSFFDVSFVLPAIHKIGSNFPVHYAILRTVSSYNWYNNHTAYLIPLSDKYIIRSYSLIDYRRSSNNEIISGILFPQMKIKFFLNNLNRCKTNEYN